MIKFISYVILISICLLLFCLKHVGNCVLDLCLDIISLIAFRIFAALNLYLSKVAHRVISLLHECSS